MTKALPSGALTIANVEYDFEDYALKHGIPDTLDPLPYRKAGSVFATGDEAEPVLTSAKHDPRLRTVVCRHWLRDLCMKGSACEFLHQYDLSKMPLCRRGEKCLLKDCPFRHISEENRLECVFYSQGFCIHGPYCRYKHLRKERADLPLVADFTLGLSQMQAAGKDGAQPRRPAPKPNEFYKISLCKHFIQGECPFGDGCHFAHGESELRKFPRQEQKQPENTELGDNLFASQEHVTVDYFRGGNSGGGLPSPIVEPDQAHFFIILAATQRDLAISTVQGKWYLQRRHAEALNHAYQDGAKQVMVFFTVSGSNHIQGAALVMSRASYQESLGKEGSHHGFDYCLNVKWYRTTEMPSQTAREAAPDLIFPTSDTSFCQTMSPRTGEALMKAVWNSPLVSLHESWTGDKEPPAPDALLSDFRAPLPEELAWPTMPGPGFIFGCSSDTMDECLGRGIFGLPAHMKGAASCIRPGASIFLMNVSDRLLFGIFEALTPALNNIEPTFASKNVNAKVSPFPVQIRVRISLECPPLEDTDPIFCAILRSRGSGRIGSLTQAQTVAVASLLANQCGALQYMIEYDKGRKEGVKVVPPPIALPPKKLRKTSQ
ncbi:30-kDa cleavage and polyadenylation specificity factor 30 [Seminavis robusta]|uniref:30-kDa cleavage and polyadenylation specificity factor 30 n=1 Tax=Seminavis robusta TaxID=568900 RepID=A0A9N8H977_9STRA|nr:30-kDa cleavage and polyadenylation specificity factor 30 [Seminavis robusta]|eukprot:Sro182_g079320.1 30-kDa cleavage and polyadenylation specificity factor 30 (603) ;mRNA; r:39486-41369